MTKEIICLTLREINTPLMKAFLLILVAGFVQQSYAQTPDTAKGISHALSDSVIKPNAYPSLSPSLRFSAGYNKNVGLKTPDSHKVQLYWDPVSMNFVPLPAKSNYRESWLSGAATFAAKTLFPFKKIE